METTPKPITSLWTRAQLFCRLSAALRDIGTLGGSTLRQLQPGEAAKQIALLERMQGDIELFRQALMHDPERGPRALHFQEFQERLRKQYPEFSGPQIWHLACLETLRPSSACCCAQPANEEATEKEGAAL